MTNDTALNAQPLPILFEDDDVIAVDKPDGLPVIPEQRPGETVLSLLAVQRPARLYVVHRLDKDASGVLLLAKNPRSHQLLNDQFSNRQVKKTYICLVHGALRADSGTINKPIRQFGSGRMGVDTRCGKASATEFRIVKRFAEHTLVEARTLTGRRHQLRVHFYHITHPIVGDRLYGDRQQQDAFPRLMLHAESLTCRLPSGNMITVRAPLSASFERFLTGLFPSETAVCRRPRR